MKFIIYGNQESKKGNPIGYHRTTQGSYWNAGSKRYNAWKAHVVASFIDGTKEASFGTGKPINLGKSKAYLHTMIYYANQARPDPDNVQKGIADALFVNDKNVAGSYDFTEDKKNPRVEVTIEVCATT